MGVASDAPRPTTLTGQWGLLRPLEAVRDADDLYRLTHGAHAAELWADMKVGPFPSAAAFRMHLDDMLADPSRSFFAVAAPDGAALGWLCLMEVQWAHRSMELGYVMFGPPLQRTTLATEAFFLIMSHIFDDLAFERLEWTCTASNLKSRKAASRLGFQFEGLMRHKLILKGITHDIPMYSLLATEWPARKAAFEAWLAPANFIDGHQQSPLR